MQLNEAQVAAIKFAASFLEDATVHTNASGLRIRALDASGVALVDVAISAGAIGIAERTFCINLPKLSRALSLGEAPQLAFSDSRATITHEEGYRVTLPLLDAKEEEIKTPEVKLGEPIALNLAVFKKLDKVFKNPLYVEFVSKDGVINASVHFEDQFDEIEVERIAKAKNDFVVRLGWAYLAPAMDLGDIMAGFGTDMPALFSMATPNGVEIAYWVAPTLRAEMAPSKETAEETPEETEEVEEAEEETETPTVEAEVPA